MKYANVKGHGCTLSETVFWTCTDGEGRKHKLSCAPGTTYAQALFLAGFWRDKPLCSGIGRCGRCAIHFSTAAPAVHQAEKDVLGEGAIARGERLGCRHMVQEGAHIRIPDLSAREEHTTPPGVVRNLAAAVDLGTTSIKWSLHFPGGVRTTGTCINPQMGSGSEVMARLAFAGRGELERKALQQAVLTALKKELTGQGIPERAVLVGNSVMITLALGREIAGLAEAPYRLAYSGGNVEVPSKDLPPCYVPRLIGPFLGADVSAGLWHLFSPRVPDREFPLLYADLGTNGELVLALARDEMFATSVALGPALEGVGLSQGAPASPGAITGFFLRGAALEPVRLEGDPAAKMTGTGYLSLLALLRRLGGIDEAGRFAADSPILSRLFTDTPRRGVRAAEGVVLDGRDVEEVLKVKAAFSLGVSRLLEEANVQPDALRRVFVAGALGEHLRADTLTTLGFLPAHTEKGIRFVGNAALLGAESLLDESARPCLEAMLKGVRQVDLTQGQDFVTRFAAHMRFIFP